MPRWVSSSLTDEEKKQLAQGTQQPAPLHPRSEDSALVPQASGQLEADPQTAAPKKRWVSADLDLGDFRGSKLQQFLPLISGQKNALDLGVHIDGGRIYRSLQLFADKTPEQAARAQKVVDMAAGQVPFDVVISNQQEWEKWAEEGKIIKELLEKDADGRYKYPITAGWLLDPKKMVLAKDDLKAVTALEHAAREHRQSEESVLKTIDRALGYSAMGIYKTMAQLPGLAVGIANYLPNKVLQTLGVDFRLGVPDYLFNNALTQYFEEQQEELRPIEVEKSPVELLAQGKYEEAAESLAVHTLVNVPQLAMLVLGHAAYGAKAFYAGAGMLAGTPAMDEALDEDLDPAMAAERAILHGIAEGIFEIPTLGLIKGFGKPLVNAAGKPGAVKVIRNMALRILGAGTVEGASEAATSAAQDFADVLTGDKDAMDGATIRLLDAALVGFTLGGGIGTVSGVAGLPGQITRNAQQKQALAEFEEAAAQSKLRQRAPEQFEEFADGVIRDNNLNPTFTVSLDALKTFYQKDPDRLNEVIEKLDLQDQVQDAEEAGTELKVALSKWVAHAPELNLPDTFKDHIRFEDTGLTANEIRAEAEQLGETLTELHAELAADTQAQALPAKAAAIRDRLMLPKKRGGLGLKAADADANIAVLMAGARALSQHRGESAEQWFDRVNPVLKIGAAAPEAGVRGAVQFDDAQTIIHLFETADRSTFMHETAHIFTQQMSDLVAAGVSDAQLQKDLDTLKTFAGQLDRAGHEKIARAFEAYLYEGKAPSIKLREAFRRFRRWLTTIHKALGGTGVALNDETRGVFDRMLAAETDIYAAQAYYAFKKSITDYVKPTKREATALDKKKQRATEDAIDRQTHTYLGAYIKAQGGKARFRAQAKKEIDGTPVYAAMRDAIDGGGLDTGTIAAEHGQETVRRLKSKSSRLAVKNGKATLEQLAVRHNFESPDALLDALLEADTIAGAVTARTNRLLAQAEANIRADLVKQERVAGEAALHNDASLEYMIAEVNLVQKKIARATNAKLRKLQAAAIKDAAEEHIGKKKVKEATRPDRYEGSLKAALNAAHKAAKKGDWAEARKQKMIHIVQVARSQAARRARDERRKIEARYKPTKIKSRLKSVENHYADAIIQILVGHGLTQSKTLKMPKGDPLGELLKQDTNLAHLIPHKLSDPPQGGWKDITMDELRELDASVETLRADGSNELKALEDSQYKTSDDVVDASMEAMDGLKDKKVYDEFSKKGAFLRKVDGARHWGGMVQFIFDLLDNFQFLTTGTFGPLRKLFNEVRNAEARQRVFANEIIIKSKPHWDVLRNAAQRLHKEAGGEKGFDIPGVPIPEHMRKNLGRRWTGERVIAVAFNMGNAGNIRALKGAYEYTDEQLNRIVSLLTKTELEAVQGIWDITESLLPQINKVHFNLYNRHVKKVKAQPLNVTAKDGEQVTLPGGYYPLIFDSLLNDRAAALSEEDLIKNETAAVFRTTKPEDGFTYGRREDGRSLPPDLSFGVWVQHIGKTTRYIMQAEVLRDLNRVTTHPAWVEKVRQKTGRRITKKDLPQVYEYIRMWVFDQARPRQAVQDQTGYKILRYLRKTSTGAILGFKFFVGVKQRLSMTSGLRAVGLRHIFGAGLSHVDLRTSLYGSTRAETYKQMMRLSVYMKARDGNIDREISNVVGALNPLARRFKVLGREFTWQDVKDKAFIFIKMNDRATVSIVWTAAFNKHMDRIADNRNLTDDQKIKEAVEHADSAVQDTQPSSLNVDLSQLQRSQLMLAFTSFMTWTLKFGNIVANVWDLGTKSRRPFKQKAKVLAGHLSYELALAGFLLVWIGAWRTGEWPELKDYPLALIEMLLSPIPVIREIPYAYKFSKGVGRSPIFETFERGRRVLKSGEDVIADDGELSRFFWEVGRLTEILTGVPALNVVKDMKKQYENITED